MSKYYNIVYFNININNILMTLKYYFNNKRKLNYKGRITIFEELLRVTSFLACPQTQIPTVARAPSE